VDGNEQCSSNVKEAPSLKRNKCNSIAKVRKWYDTYLRYGSFLKDDQILIVPATFQKCKDNQVIKFLDFLTSVITDYLLKCRVMKYLIFLHVIKKKCCWWGFHDKHQSISGDPQWQKGWRAL